MPASDFMVKDLTRITDEDLAAVAASIAVEPEALGAVYDVESGGTGYNADGSCLMRFEAGIFSGTYGHLAPAGDPNSYATLDQAIAVNRRDALLSTSWGLFQIMGFNFKYCELADVEAHVAQHCQSERRQLELVGTFLVNYCDCAGLLRKHDWAGFAYHYNGPNYKQNNYDVKLEEAYLARKGGAAPAPPPPATGKPMLSEGSTGRDVLDLKGRLDRWQAGDFYDADTRARVQAFQKANGLDVDGIVGDATWAALEPYAVKAR